MLLKHIISIKFDKSGYFEKGCYKETDSPIHLHFNLIYELH